MAGLTRALISTSFDMRISLATLPGPAAAACYSPATGLDPDLASDPACDTAGCDTGIGAGEWVAVGLLAAGGTALVLGAILIAREAGTRVPWMAWATTIPGLVGGAAGLSLL